MDGLLPINKARGMTSADVVYRARKILGIKKIGHSGTLDPNVDGVLPLAIGTATKAISQLQSSGKVYTGEVTLGLATTTEDLDGDVVERTPLVEPITVDKIDAAMRTFLGDITQVVPLYSAVRVNGRRLYEYARAGETVERPRRSAHIAEFLRTSTPTFNASEGTESFTFSATVSKGTYIRTLSVDLGRKLGLAAVMSQLTRQRSGGFSLTDSVTLAELASAVADGSVDQLIDGVDRAYATYPAIELTSAQWEIVRHGHSFLAPTATAPFVRVYWQNTMKGVYKLVDGAYKPNTMYLANTVPRATGRDRQHRE